MRDYKNVRVPKRDRTRPMRATVKRTKARTTRRVRTPSAGGIASRMLLMVVIASAIVLGWQGYRWAVRAEVFRVKGFDVKGVRHLTEDSIRRIAGAVAGENIFTLDLDGVAERARAHPWIKGVRVHRSLPDRITMVVSERVPAAILETAKGRYLMDNEAVPLAKLNAGDAPELPSITIGSRSITIGEQIADAGIHQGLELLAELSARGGWTLQEITVKAGTAEALAVRYGGRELRIGAGNFTEKLRRLSEVTADLRQRGQDFSYIDLRAERQVAVLVRR